MAIDLHLILSYVPSYWVYSFGGLEFSSRYSQNSTNRVKREIPKWVDESSDEDDNEFGAIILPAIAAALIREDRSRIKQYVEDVVPAYLDHTFQRVFRMSRDTLETIHSYMKDCKEFDIANDHGGRVPLSVKKHLMITLWYIGSQDTIHRIADRFGVSESTVLSSRSKVVSAAMRCLMPKLLTWPTHNEIPTLKAHFERKNGFPGIIGCLDGTRIRLSAPSEHQKSYVNRKGYHSLQLQAVCREYMPFTDCFCGYPGSCHDSRILKNSDLWTNGPLLCGADHIVADGGYPLQSWLLTPYRDNGHLNLDQRNFNRRLSSNRVVIERAFGLLKGRFRRLDKLVTCEVETAVDIIMACCIFHNICIQLSDVIDEFMQMDDCIPQIHSIQRHPLAAEGVMKRDGIARNLPH